MEAFDIGTIGITVLGIVLVLAAIIPYMRWHRGMEKKAFAAEQNARDLGLKEPVTLHPVVNPDACIGTGSCLAVCPEKDVLGLVSGQARPISVARCIGHGLCERACPVDAIQLVFGTDRRGVDIPRIKGNFETNVPGIYIVGELGGMGLIKNAFEQGRQCVEGIMKEKRESRHDVLDVVVVGCGPAGISASLNCLNAGLKFATLEKEDIGGTVRTYPRKKLVMTHPFSIPGYGKFKAREIQKEDLIELWEDIVSKTGLEVTTGVTVTGIEKGSDGVFTIRTVDDTYRAFRVILAIGRRGVPRKLDVPGEEQPKVAYSLREPEAFTNDRILVVGGGDSAIEAAVALSEQVGNVVSLSYRKDKFARIKPDNHARITAAIAQNRVRVLWNTNVDEILNEAVIYRNADDSVEGIANDYVFVFAGGVLPTGFLKKCGIEIDTKFGQPVRAA